MNLQILNPLDIPNWDDLVLATGKASIFHSVAWARVLHESYGYKPLYFASFEDGKLSCLMPFMEVDSWITGKRGVSLPFTDQCAAIMPERTFFEEAVKEVMDYAERAGWRYIEWRDGIFFSEQLDASEIYHSHELNLAKSEEQIFSALRDSTRRNIKKASKVGLAVEINQSLDSMKSFYKLNCITRKRHGLPPQPFPFFKKIFENVISKGHGIEVSAIHRGKVIASAVFFHFGKNAIYKYGASDLAHQHLRANNMVMWEAIKWSKEMGLESFNLGRTEPENQGLLQFKRGWGAKESILKYHRYEIRKKGFRKRQQRAGGLMYKTFACSPQTALKFVGTLLYKHIG
jgi:hypothetical protein